MDPLYTEVSKVALYRKYIISQARIIYGTRYAENNVVFNVLLYHKDLETVAQLIVYAAPGSLSAFRVLKEACETSQEKDVVPYSQILASSMENMQGKIDRSIPKLRVGQTWDGKRITETE